MSQNLLSKWQEELVLFVITIFIGISLFLPVDAVGALTRIGLVVWLLLLFRESKYWDRVVAMFAPADDIHSNGDNNGSTSGNDAGIGSEADDDITTEAEDSPAR